MRKIISAAFVATSLMALSAHAANVAGTLSATFTNPQPANTVFSGVGTNSFTWGNPGTSGVGANNLTFVGTAFNSPMDTAFKIGTLTYFNGTTVANSTASSVTFSSSIDFSQPSLPTVNSAFTMTLNSTPNTTNATDSADFVNFSNTTSASNFVIDGVTYTVKITGFQNVVGDGFLVSSPTEFRVQEGKTASADLFAVVTAATPVPEPETYAMMLAGLGLLGSFARRKKAQKSA